MIRVMQLNNTSLTALGGVISALSVFLMLLAGIIPNMTYVIPAISGILLIVTIREADLKWSLFIYISVAVLSLLIVADKEAAVMYTFFFGYYPVAKAFYEKHLNKVLCVLAKFITFNAAILAGYALLIYVFLIPVEGLDRFGKYGALVLLGIGNVIFILYDRIITSLNAIYDKRLHKRLSHLFKM